MTLPEVGRAPPRSADHYISDGFSNPAEFPDTPKQARPAASAFEVGRSGLLWHHLVGPTAPCSGLGIVSRMIPRTHALAYLIGMPALLVDGRSDARMAEAFQVLVRLTVMPGGVASWPFS